VIVDAGKDGVRAILARRETAAWLKQRGDMRDGGRMTRKGLLELGAELRYSLEMSCQAQRESS
jgi:hypothetical protein